jgi:hypothetical protein
VHDVQQEYELHADTGNVWHRDSKADPKEMIKSSSDLIDWSSSVV